MTAGQIAAFLLLHPTLPVTVEMIDYSLVPVADVYLDGDNKRIVIELNVDQQQAVGSAG